MADSNSSKNQFDLILFFCFSFIFILIFKAKLSTADDIDGFDTPVINTCNTNLKSILPKPYSDLSSLTCSPIWQQRFAFSDGNNVTTIVLSGIHDDRWIGVAFSSDGRMVGSSAVVGWAGKDGVSGIKQYSLEGKNVSEVIPDKGDLRFTNAKPVVVVHEKKIYMAFQLQFQKSLAFQPILLAIGDGNPNEDFSLTKHSDETSTFIEFSSGHLSGQAADVNDLRRYHGWAGIIGWGILTPAGGMVARYFKHHDPLWYYLHSSTHIVGFLFGLISISIGHNLYNKISAIFSIHKFFGFTAFALYGLEICQLIVRPSSDSKFRKHWNLAHYLVGTTAIVLGVTNIIIGFYKVEADKSLKLVYLFIFIVWFISVVVLELRHHKENSIQNIVVEEPPVFRANR